MNKHFSNFTLVKSCPFSSEEKKVFSTICESVIFETKSAFLGLSEPASTLNRLREFSETFLSMSSLPDLAWWLYPELASTMPEIKD